jgi:diguanylate cyclase (GGDEF)-like protein/PAS domain S-box-containing protein
MAALLALVLGCVSTAALFTWVRRFEHQKSQIDFQQRADERIAAVKEGMNGAVEAVIIANQLFATMPSVSRQQFQQFTRPLLQRYPYIQAFNFHRIVSGAELHVYEHEMRKRYPDFAVTELVDGKPVPVRAKARYQVVDYLEPMKGNEAAFGLDTSSNPQVAEVLQRAIDTGLPSATDLSWLAQGGASRRGFLVLMPVYRYGRPTNSIAARRAAVIGDTAAVFRMEDLIDKFLLAGGFSDMPNINISIYASSEPDDRYLVFRRGTMPIATPAGSLLPQWLFYNRPETVSHNLDVAGKSWRIVISSPPVWFGRHHSGSLLILIGGALLTLLAAAYLHSITARAQRIQKLVDQRTAELKQSNEWLTEDIAARERAEQALKLRERAIEASPNAILIIRASAPDYPIEYVNPAFERMTGYRTAEATGRNYNFLWGDDVDQAGMEEIRCSVHKQREGHATLRNYRKDGALFWSDIYLAPVRNEDGAVTHFVVAMYDVTSTKRYEAELEFQAKRDILTGLANRHLLRDRLQQAIAHADRQQQLVWVVLLDLDRFKFVNDTLGHKAGDQLLHQLAARLLSAAHEADTVARLGADEFVLILTKRDDEMPLAHAVQGVMETVSRPLVIEGHEFFLTCSTGVSAYPADGSDADVLIKHAEIAMYRAKEMGRNNFQVYTPAMNAQALERLRIEGHLRNAVERGEFVLHYQPQLDLRSGRVVGMEALIRWDHPELGMVPPARFIGLAEETGLIVPIGAWVARTACRQTKAWQDAGLGMLRVAVNLSARQFYQQDLVQSVAVILDESGLEAKYLEIELTETLVMTDVDRAIAILRDLKALGVQISIDDFGTGYSSLSYLKRFPIDVLKIDQSFVRDITVNPDDAAIVVSIISLAHSLRLQVIAEGVETEEQLAYLREHECDQMQGYYFSRPIPADAFADLLKQGKGLPGQIRRIVA